MHRIEIPTFHTKQKIELFFPTGKINKKMSTKDSHRLSSYCRHFCTNFWTDRWCNVCVCACYLFVCVGGQITGETHARVPHKALINSVEMVLQTRTHWRTLSVEPRVRRVQKLVQDNVFL